jgi:hypothetical protein
MSAWQIAKPKISDSNTEKVLHAVSDGLEHASNLTIYALAQNDANTRWRERAELRNFRALPIKNDSALQPWSKRWIPVSIQRNLIFLVALEAGVGDLLR